MIALPLPRFWIPYGGGCITRAFRLNIPPERRALFSVLHRSRQQKNKMNKLFVAILLFAFVVSALGDWCSTGPNAVVNCRNNGDYQHCTSCKIYVHCYNGQLSVRNCPVDMLGSHTEILCFLIHDSEALIVLETSRKALHKIGHHDQV
ncbi:hypothetical protein LSAT2_011066 [Lamellibrachia satsuma]|nr:hypothetical protein LSAT2_011066 [Lamellibrachia satsuma]